MRIAMVTETYPPEVNGVARTIGLMAEGLQRRGHFVELVRPRQNGRRPCATAASARSSAASRSPLRSSRWACPRAARSSAAGRKSVRTSCTWRPRARSAGPRSPRRAAWASAWRRLPHQLPHLYARLRARLAGAAGGGFCSFPTAPLAPWCRRARSPRSWRRSASSACASSATCRSILAGAALAERASWGADDGTLVALCVSRFAHEKNFALLIQAYEAMRRIRPRMRLVSSGMVPRRNDQQLNVGCVIAGRKVNGELPGTTHPPTCFCFRA